MNAVKNIEKSCARHLIFVVMLVMVSFIHVETAAAEGFSADGFDSAYKDLNLLLYIALVLGGFWTVASIIIAGAKLSSSQGNPQQRVQGIIGIVFAILGAWVVYKSLTIVGWIGSF